MKKIVSLFCILAMLLSTFVMVASGDPAPAAPTEASKWDGVIPEANPEYKFEGEGTEASPYLIKSASEFALFAANARLNNYDTTYSGKHFQLTVDIDMDNKEWMGIGGAKLNNSNGFPTSDADPYYYSYFAGYFDGAGHKIYNFNLKTVTEGEFEIKDEEGNVTGTETRTVYIHQQGLFGWVVGATIENIGIESGNVVFTNNDRSGILVGAARHGVHINNCYNKANLTVNSSTKYVMTAMILGCTFDKWENKNNTQQGAADVYQGKTIENTYNTGKLTVNMSSADASNEFRIGGIVGSFTGDSPELVNVYNMGDIEVNSTSVARTGGNARLGGIVGSFLDSAYAVDVYFNGTITFTATDTAREYSCGYLFGQVGGNFVTEPDAEGNFSLCYKGTFTANGTAVEKGIWNTTFEWDKPYEGDIVLSLAEGSDFLVEATTPELPPVTTDTPTTEKPATTTAPEKVTTAAPTTNAPTTNAPAAEEKGGCGSAVGIVSVLMLTAIASGAALSIRKKED